jgi:hypothetical protein
MPRVRDAARAHAHDARQASDQPGGLDPPDGLDRGVGIALGGRTAALARAAIA